MLASRRNGTLSIGVTSDLLVRIWQHREGLCAGFTARYGVHLLVWFELHGTMAQAIAREKALKHWRRAWKIALIEVRNPEWVDLYPGLVKS
jgi:putative endonuclease